MNAGYATVPKRKVVTMIDNCKKIDALMSKRMTIAKKRDSFYAARDILNRQFLRLFLRCKLSDQSSQAERAINRLRLGTVTRKIFSLNDRIADCIKKIAEVDRLIKPLIKSS